VPLPAIAAAIARAAAVGLRVMAATARTAGASAAGATRGAAGGAARGVARAARAASGKASSIRPKSFVFNRSRAAKPKGGGLRKPGTPGVRPRRRGGKLPRTQLPRQSIRIPAPPPRASIQPTQTPSPAPNQYIPPPRPSLLGRISQFFSGGSSGGGGGGGGGSPNPADDDGPRRVGQDVAGIGQKILRGVLVGGAAGLAAKGADVSIRLPAIVRDLGNSLIEAKRKFAELNGAIAVSVGMLDAQRFGRSVRMAAATAGSTRSLTQAQSRLEERLLPYQVTMSNALNKLLIVATTIAEGILTGWELMGEMPVIGDAAKAVVKWINKGGNADDKQPLKQLASDIASGKYSGRNNPPARP